MRKYFLMIMLMPLFFVPAYAQDAAREVKTEEVPRLPAARIAYISGYDLIEWLDHYNAAKNETKGISYYPVGKAWGFIVGVVDARSSELNIPEDLKLKQIITIVSEFIRLKHDRWQEPAADLVIEALKKGLPAAKMAE